MGGQVHVESMRRRLDVLQREYPHAAFLDVTSRGDAPWIRFSPFFPHGNIPVPFSPGYMSASVEGIWQGLKVFTNEDVDTKRFEIRSMRGIKRSAGMRGRILGHRKGVHGGEILSYVEARRLIYVPAYNCVLANRLSAEIAGIMGILNEQDVVLLDYETNVNIDDISRPLSHASLVQLFMTDR